MEDLAQQLIGYELDGGWIIRRMRPALISGTGGGACGAFSASNQAGAEVFIKVLDIRLDQDHPEPTLEATAFVAAKTQAKASKVKARVRADRQARI